VKDAEVTSPRVKSRLLVQFQNDSFPHVSREDFDRLLEARAPWFDARIDEIFWSAAIRFEKRRSSSYGTGRVWIVGDAAHLASPVAIRSMNVGLREAKDWADRVGRILRGAGTPESLTEFDELWRREWDGLYGLGQDAKVAGSGDPWIAARAGRIADCIPASGDNLKLLMGQLGIYV
jgi:2-polyprenyl-6-methoxyphenol hydroxylase-like FAD-dependent oxidoreductase